MEYIIHTGCVINAKNSKMNSSKKLSKKKIKRVSVPIEKILCLKNVMVIDYEWWAGKCNMGFWRGRLNGGVENYGTKEQLTKKAKDKNNDWMVLRWHKDGSGKCSIVSASKNSFF